MSKIIFKIALFSVFMAALTSCKEKAVTAPTPPDAQVKAPDSAPQQPAYRPPAPPPVVASPDSGPDLKQINHAYIGWIIQNRRRPKTFEEYIAASGMQVPTPPVGKKYIIDRNGFINLMNN